MGNFKTFSIYIIVLIAGILAAKGLFVFLDRQPLRADKVEPSVAPIEVRPQPIEVRPQPERSQQRVKKEPAHNLVLTGIASSGNKSWAIINNRVFKLGDRIGKMQIIAITGKKVDLGADGEIITLKLNR